MMIVNHLPFLGSYKRAAVALRDSWASRASYSQHGEDVRIAAMLSKFVLPDIVYVDVGANHPTDISNSYLLYRQGHSGIVIDPNTKLLRLFSWVRPRDIALPVGCGSHAGVAQFTISKTPVLSSFAPLTETSHPWKTIYAPILTLDSIVSEIKLPWLPFLSVDAEGLSGAVLEGAKMTLSKTYLVCVEAEAGTAEEESVRLLLSTAEFSVLDRVGCNLLATNPNLSQFRIYMKPA